MADKIKVRRGLISELPNLDEAEFGLATDTGTLYIGTEEATNILINPVLAFQDGYSVDGYLVPAVDNVHNLGTPENRWHSVYVGPGSLNIVAKDSDAGYSANQEFKISVDADTGALQFISGDNNLLMTLDPSSGVEFPIGGTFVDSALSQTFEENKNAQNQVNQSVIQSLDGYQAQINALSPDITFQEFKAQQSQVNQSVLQSLDGYTATSDTASTGDGYLAFYTGVGRNIAGDNDLFWDRENHRLGIGTSTPTQALFVSAANDPRIVLAENGDTGSNLRFEDTSANLAAIEKVVASGNSTLYINALPIDNVGEANVVLFRSTNTVGNKDFSITRGDGTSTTDHRLSSGTRDSFLVNGGGNLGIGVTAPGYKLDVAGDINVAGAIYNHDLSETIDAIRQAADGYTSTPNVGATGDGYIAFYTGVGRNIAGDEDLYYDRLNSVLSVRGGSSKVEVGDADFNMDFATDNDVPRINFDTSNRIRLVRSSDSIFFDLAGSTAFSISSIAATMTRTFRPGADNTYDLGASGSLQWRHGYFSGSLRAETGLVVGFVGTAAANEIQLGDANFKLDYVSSSSTALQFDTGDMLEYDRTSNFFAFDIGTTERLRITNVGRVGINNVNPQAMLHVSGDGYFDGYLMPFTDDTWGLGTPQKRWRDLYLGPGSLHIVTDATQTETGITRDWTLGTNVDGYLLISQGIDNAITINSDGDMHLGSSGATQTIAGVPSRLLVKRKSGQWGISIDADTGNQADLIFRDQDNSTDNQIVQFVNGSVTDQFAIRRITDAGTLGQNLMLLDLAANGRMTIGSGTLSYSTTPVSNIAGLVLKSTDADVRMTAQGGDGRFNIYVGAYYDGAYKRINSGTDGASRITMESATGSQGITLSHAVGGANGSAITWITGLTVNASGTTMTGTDGDVVVTNDGVHMQFTRPSTNYIHATSAGGSFFFTVNGNADTSPAMKLLSDNTMNLAEVNAGTPATGYGAIYPTTLGDLHFKNDAGQDHNISKGYILAASYVSATSLTAPNSYFFPPVGLTLVNTTATEADHRIKLKGPGSITGIRIQVSTNTLATANGLMNLRINGSVVATITIPVGGGTGEFTTATVPTFADGDYVCWQYTSAGATGSVVIKTIQFTVI